MIILLIALLKPWYKAVVVFAGTIATGFVVHAVVAATAGSAWTSGKTISGAGWLSHWVVIPKVAHGNFDNILYIGLVAAIVLVASLKGWWRIIALGPTLYLTAVVWENVLSENPAGDGVDPLRSDAGRVDDHAAAGAARARREWRSSDGRGSGAHRTLRCSSSTTSRCRSAA